MNKGKAATALAVAVALLALAALDVLPQPERNPYVVHEVPEEPYAKTGADAPDATGYAVAAGIALAAAAGAGGVLAYRKRKTAGASKDAAAEEPAEEPEE